MKHKILFLILYLLSNVCNAQSYILGDTTNKFIHNIGDTLSDLSMDIDIDCDSIMDLQFNSHLGGSYYKDWVTLTFIMDTNTEVAIYQSGRVLKYEFGDTVFYDSILWASNVSDIYGYGVAGSYGYYKSDTDFILFRKILSLDTSYIFIEFSNLYARMIVHKIISTCNGQNIITRNIDSTNQMYMIYPNPFNRIIQSNFSFKELIVYDYTGRIYNWNWNGDSIDVGELPRGIYILLFRCNDDSVRRFKMLKN